MRSNQGCVDSGKKQRIIFSYVCNTVCNNMCMLMYVVTYAIPTFPQNPTPNLLIMTATVAVNW